MKSLTQAYFVKIYLLFDANVNTKLWDVTIHHFTCMMMLFLTWQIHGKLFFIQKEWEIILIWNSCKMFSSRKTTETIFGLRRKVLLLLRNFFLQNFLENCMLGKSCSKCIIRWNIKNNTIHEKCLGKQMWILYVVAMGANKCIHLLFSLLLWGLSM